MPNLAAIYSPSLEQSLMQLGNTLRTSHFLVKYNQEIFYPATYVGELVLQLLAFLNESKSGQVSLNKRKWIKGDLPIKQQPKIEVGFEQALELIERAIVLAPSKECEEYKDFFMKLRANLISGSAAAEIALMRG
jgi:hypothetical protein